MRRRAERRALIPAAAVAGSAALLALLAPSGAAAQAPPPVVEVTFHIDPASQLVHPDWLDGKEIRAAQDRLSKLLAGRCRSTPTFGFVRWVAVLPRQPVSPGVPRLTLRLYDVPRSDKTVDIRLEFVKTMDNMRRSISVLGPRTPLVDWWNTERPATADKLYDLVAAKLESSEAFASESFRTALHEHFLKWIPLARHVIPDENAKRIVVPLRWDAIRAYDTTVLVVKFMARRCPSTQAAAGAAPPSAGRREGTMRLSTLAKRHDRPHLGALQSAVTFLDCAPLELRGWGDEIPGLLTSNVIRGTTKVFMETYYPADDATYAEALLTDPH